MKNRILSTALDLAVQNSVENLSLGHVAGKLQISPRVIYVCFKSRQNLVCELLAHIYKLLQRKAEEVEKCVSNPMLALMLISMNYVRYLALLSPDVLEEIKKNSEAYAMALKCKAYFFQVCSRYFEEAKKDGFIHPLLQARQVSTAYVNSLEKMGIEVDLRLILDSLKVYCTDKGCEELCRYACKIL